MGPPKRAPNGMASPNNNNANKDAIMGSPRGTEDTAVGVIYLTAQFNKLCPKMDGTNPRNKNKCKKSI